MLWSTSTNRKKRSFKTYRKSKKEDNALIEKKLKKICPEQEKEEDRKKLNIIRKYRFLTIRIKRVSQVWQKAWKVEKSLLPVPNEK